MESRQSLQGGGITIGVCMCILVGREMTLGGVRPRAGGRVINKGWPQPSCGGGECFEPNGPCKNGGLEWVCDIGGGVDRAEAYGGGETSPPSSGRRM